MCKKGSGISLLFFLWIFPSILLAQTTVFLAPADALRLIFKDSQEVYKEDKVLDPQLQAQAKALLGYIPPREIYSFYLGKTGHKIDGYALIDEQVGKVLPITFITRISPQGKVEAVEVMVFRESRGGEVKAHRFLRQFKDKDLSAPLKLRGDIVNITGATLSSRALVLGVKRALVLWKLFYGNTSPQSSESKP